MTKKTIFLVKMSIGNILKGSDILANLGTPPFVVEIDIETET